MPGTGVELNRFRAKLLIHRFEQLTSLLRVDETGGRVLHEDMRPEFLDVGCSIFATGGRLPPHRHHGAPEHHVLLTHRDAETGRLQRTGARIILFRIISQHSHTGDITSSGSGFRGKAQQPHLATLGDLVKVRSCGRLKRGFSTEFRTREICHPVGMQDQIFHAMFLR